MASSGDHYSVHTSDLSMTQSERLDLEAPLLLIKKVHGKK